MLFACLVGLVFACWELTKKVSNLDTQLSSTWDPKAGCLTLCATLHSIFINIINIEVNLFQRNYTACTRERVKQHVTVGWRE